MTFFETLTAADVQKLLRVAEALHRSRLRRLSIETDGLQIVVGKDGLTVAGQPGAGVAEAAVTAPAVGIFRAWDSQTHRPGVPVTAGTRLAAIAMLDETIPVEAQQSGTLAEICVPDGGFVEYGQILFRLHPAQS